VRNKHFDTLEYCVLEIVPYFLNTSTIACPYCKFIPDKFIWLQNLLCCCAALLDCTADFILYNYYYFGWTAAVLLLLLLFILLFIHLIVFIELAFVPHVLRPSCFLVAPLWGGVSCHLRLKFPGGLFPCEVSLYAFPFSPMLHKLQHNRYENYLEGGQPLGLFTTVSIICHHWSLINPVHTPGLFRPASTLFSYVIPRLIISFPCYCRGRYET
jgi:hypothetical protein